MRTTKQLKMRRNLAKSRPKKVFRKPKKNEIKVQVPIKSTCVNGDRKDSTRYVHAPRMMFPAKKLFCSLYRDFYTFSRFAGFPANMRDINRRNPTADKVMLALLVESIYTDTNLMNPPGRSMRLPLLLKPPTRQTRMVRSYGSYVRDADSFIQKANEYLSCVHRKQQKKINLIKSQFVPAFKEAKKILSA